MGANKSTLQSNQQHLLENERPEGTDATEAIPDACAVHDSAPTAQFTTTNHVPPMVLPSLF